MTTNHSPTPWKLWNGYGPLPNGKWAVARIGPGDYDASLIGAEGHDIIGRKEVLERVVLAVNSHEALVEAVKAALAAGFDGSGDYIASYEARVKPMLRAALGLTEEE